MSIKNAVDGINLSFYSFCGISAKALSIYAIAATIFSTATDEPESGFCRHRFLLPNPVAFCYSHFI